MPAFVAFGRRWKLGSDDFIFPASIDTAVKISWLLAAIVIFVTNESDFDYCHDKMWARFYFYGIIISIAMSLVIDIAVIRNSMKGAIMDVGARSLVETLVYLRLGWEVADVGLNITGTIWIFYDKFGCLEVMSPFAFGFIRRFVICNWVSIAIIIMLIIYFYDSNGSLNASQPSMSQCANKYDVPIYPKSYIWGDRFKRLFCYFGRSKPLEPAEIPDGFYEVGRILTFLLQQTEFVPSDIVAGLIALFAKEGPGSKKAQNCNHIKHDEYFIPVITKAPTAAVMATSIKNNTEENVKKLIIPSPETQVYQLRHFFNFVHGSSGWRGFLTNRLKNAICRLWKSSICCGCIRKPYKFEIVGDNCCFCNTSALKQSLPELKEEDLLYASFKCDFYQVPFYIALDHCTKSIVVSLRGSYSMEDFITDYSGIPTPFVLEDQPPEETYLAHHGMLLAAQNVNKKLDSLNILPKAKEQFPDYKIVLVGQSLGGGAAAILGLLLHLKYNDLKVYAFNSPGGVLSLNAAQLCESFVTTVIYGDDMLARASIRAMVEFKHRIIHTIRDCRTPKYKILCKGLTSCLCGHESKLSYYSDESTKIDNKDIKIQLDVSHMKCQSSEIQYTQLMYLPGKIIHITENPRFGTSEKEVNEYFRFNMRWADRNEFLRIKISPRMNADHSHFRMIEAFDEYL